MIYNSRALLQSIADSKANGILYSISRHRCNRGKDRVYALLFENGKPVGRRYRVSLYDPDIPVFLFDPPARSVFRARA